MLNPKNKPNKRFYLNTKYRSDKSSSFWVVQILVHHVDENNKNIKKRPTGDYLFKR